MSHFTTVKTQIKDLTLLDAAARALGLQKVDRTVVNGFVGQKTDADHVWQVSKGYDVGAIKASDGTYSLIADWWGTDRTIPGLDNKLKQQYGIQAALRRAKLLGHQLLERDVKADGTVELRIRA